MWHTLTSCHPPHNYPAQQWYRAVRDDGQLQAVYRRHNHNSLHKFAHHSVVVVFAVRRQGTVWWRRVQRCWLRQNCCWKHRTHHCHLQRVHPISPISYHDAVLRFSSLLLASTSQLHPLTGMKKLFLFICADMKRKTKRKLK